MKQNNKKPLIGILANRLIMEGGVFPGQERAYVNQEYVDSLVKAGASPVLLPIIADEKAMFRQLECMDGVLLSGGYDIHPLLYGEEPHPKLEFVYPERDEYEIKMVKKAYRLGKPILGICRGLQLINVAFGGTLYQDLSLHDSKGRIQHIQKAKMHIASHTIDVMPETRLYQIFNQSTVVTNSFHHQAVKDLAPSFIVNAKAKDGIIEGIEKAEGSFVLGVQWHAEMMTSHYPEMKKLFEAFVEEARKEGGVG